MVDEVYQLFFDEDANSSQIEFPIVYSNAPAGIATLEQGAEGDSIKPLLDLIVTHIPAPTHIPGHPMQAQVANLDASPYLGRLALCRVRHGTVQRGATVAWCRRDGTVTRAKLTELLVTEGLERAPAESAGPGDIIAVAGIDEITIGETIADADDPVRCR